MNNYLTSFVTTSNYYTHVCIITISDRRSASTPASYQNWKWNDPGTSLATRKERMLTVLYIVLCAVLLAMLLIIGIACYQTHEDTPTWFKREQRTAQRWSVNDPLTDWLINWLTDQLIRWVYFGSYTTVCKNLSANRWRCALFVDNAEPSGGRNAFRTTLVCVW